MNRTVYFLTILLVLTLLAACGSQPAVEEDAAPAEGFVPAAESELSSEEITVEETATSEEEASNEAAPSGDSCDEGFRTFEDAVGQLCVPDVAERIVATHCCTAAPVVFRV